ncbi:cytochrome c oxidase subunit II [Halorussus salinus]|uniref:cytochrome c oxidase subunit II n=1 Tax=Halorussus salinus TaxID=1364935 RepID=UPI00192F426F|nr:cytochrome c oxidase subunit II [Halorussus salinus]
MIRWSVLAAGALVALGVATVSPVAAQSVNRNLIDQLNLQLIYVALPLTLFVEVILVYAVIRFRNNDDPEPTAENPTLEVTWTVATAIVLVFVGWSAYNVLASPYISPTPEVEAAPPDVEPDAEIDVLAYQWGWQFDYAAANVTTQNLLVLPRDEDARLRLRSDEVLHSLYVPELGLKQDVFPGQNTTILTRALENGRYRGYCTEFCGDGHARMRAQVYVVDPETYRQWLAAHEDERLVTAPPNASVGNATGAANATAATSRFSSPA